MSDAYQQIREYLSGSSRDLPNISELPEACHRRLVRALQSSNSRSGDITVLVRHMLRREAEQLSGNSSVLKIHRRKPFPSDREAWELASMNILDEKQDYFLIEARSWSPDWLEGSDLESPDVPIFKEVERRNYEPEAGDPFLARFGFDTYQSAGQREAIRAILTAPSRSTLVVNLPTGSGKSLCAHLPAWLKSNPRGVTIVVVPTVALAIDQERTFQNKTGINHETAYYSGTSISGQERRDEIRDRIRDGTQVIVFTSPEGLLESLASSVYEAANQGLIRYFVVDEAHIVEQWGDEFRPSFQELPGFRRDLLRLTEFPTLLLTATVTESCLDTLESLFGNSDPAQFQVVSSVQLRPEPSYWFASCEDRSQKKQWVTEAMYNLPRPLIIYCSKKEDVKTLYEELRQEGFSRIDMMTGDSSHTKRQKLLDDWQDRRIDAVVATSAFGLGIDLPDVRAVIHACIPETIDRFYQEVGRGGRDGKATLSLTIYLDKEFDPEDFKISKNLNEVSHISLDKGLPRWLSLFRDKVVLPNDHYRVPIRNPPIDNIDLKSEENEKWNIRTLTLMSKAGLLEMDFEMPPQRANFELYEEYLQVLKEYRGWRTIRILNQFHLNRDTWQELVEPVREERQKWSRHSLKLMKEALRPKRCISEIFSDAYFIDARKNPPRQKIRVSLACGGCPFCRKKKLKPFADVMTSPLPVWKTASISVGEALKQQLAGGTSLAIFYSPFENKLIERRRNNLFAWMIAQGTTNIVAPKHLHEVFANAAGNIPIFLFEKYLSRQMPQVPTLIFHPEDPPLPKEYLQISETNLIKIILMPRDIPDPTSPHRRLIDVYNERSFVFERFCNEVSI